MADKMAVINIGANRLLDTRSFPIFSFLLQKTCTNPSQRYQDRVTQVSVLPLRKKQKEKKKKNRQLKANEI